MNTMKLLIEAHVSHRRGGLQATAPQLRLAGHGTTQDEALASLRSTAAAWVLGLSLAGGLDEALDRSGVRREDQESEGMSIELRLV
jgi:hypothetical protein